MNCCVAGAGGWGTTIAIMLHENGHNVTLWDYDPEHAKLIFETRENSLYLPGVKISKEIKITSDLDISLKKKHIVVLAIPTQFLRSMLERIDFSLIKNSTVVNLAKGIETTSLKRVSEIIKDIFPEVTDEQISTISGPSHAEEVSRKIPTTVVAASTSYNTAMFVQSAFMNPYFRVYVSNDIVGVELGGSLKNVIAIGAGICDGAGFGDNTKAAIMTRGIAEISRLGVALGARPETFAGLSGMGDVIVTCMSKHSRNRFVGQEIGRGKSLEQVLSEMDMVAEGIATSKSVYLLSKKVNVEVPICSEVYRILYEQKDPILATTELMTRQPKEEIWS
jgi:glycerol-3-phosphate dehydrogenase (NAD(P)+)